MTHKTKVKREKLRANAIVVSDFDGTITVTDNTQCVLQKFADKEWMRLDELYEKGMLELVERVKRQYALLRASSEEIVKYAKQLAVLREGFARFVGLCNKKGLPLVVVSVGLDIVVKELLKFFGFEKIRVRVPKTLPTEQGYKVFFPKMHTTLTQNIKEDLVLHNKILGKKVIYLGDGPSDYQAIRRADFRFVVKGSKLEELCVKNGVVHAVFSSFDEVSESLEKYILKLL
ncbi:hypothetical protein B9Q11_04535 [Candidatus Marsarchaeota G2 archaeon ECH_B_SAG-F08]|jgi:2-hydroxy-3-keto-5-methylthiopentenyl-1-phosphate phosphatase|uniref:Phosphoserine phosphatase n=1 Tax=Candidatus Marsarchaeota G2 archaeon ECH_B_SAG-F08 TaxID=1978165 RepID=A0A2R6BF40_9ARCH|nr:MAG: hypothetical protein B9Q11_04535 [Candidatus Marsarchaeota G2 archaeon ECH_B_SAG-F08]